MRYCKKEMLEKKLTYLKVLSIVLLVVGLLLIGFAITGRVIGNTSSDYCTDDITCASGKICCIVQGGSGMCYEPEVCTDLKSNAKDFSAELPLKEDYSQYTDIGIGILILAVILLVILYLIEKKNKKKKKARKR